MTIYSFVMRALLLLHISNNFVLSSHWSSHYIRESRVVVIFLHLALWSLLLNSHSIYCLSKRARDSIPSHYFVHWANFYREWLINKLSTMLFLTNCPSASIKEHILNVKVILFLAVVYHESLINHVFLGGCLALHYLLRFISPKIICLFKLSMRLTILSSHYSQAFSKQYSNLN